jgi:hypothetical protein
MALVWSIERCAEPPEVLRGEGREFYITETLIWATIAVDLPGITEDNAAEFYARYHTWEQLFGPMTRLDGEDHFITPQDVRRRIGLTANVSLKTRSAWLKSIGDIAISHSMAAYKQQTSVVDA